MGYIALYRKWRPQVFEDVVEQEHVVQTLKHSVKTGHIAHAYLFCGTRGTGKTTVAHILSRAINCLNPKDGDPCNECEICKGILSGTILDVMEIDAASNNSVDNVREIRDDVIYAPSQARYKVYIIDEVHMLSTGAFNALLKTLEEPPAHVVFILATTEPHKLPATILSRCQRFDFRRITAESIANRLETIAAANGVKVSRDALRLIARMSEGAMRDAISLLDQCISTGKQEISYEDVMSVIGMVEDSFIAELVDTVNSKDVGKVLELVDRLVMNGKDIARFASDLVLYYRNLLICKVAAKPGEIIEASPDTLELMKRQAGTLTREELTFIIKELSLLESGLKWAAHPRILLEVSLIKLCEGCYTYSNDDILDRLAMLEKKLESGDYRPRPAAGNTAGGGSAKAESGKKAPSASENVPEKQAAKPAAEKPEASGSSKQVATLECWDKILSELMKSGRMALYTYLFGTKAVELGRGIIGIVFAKDNSINKLFVSKAENLQVIEEMVRRYLGLTEVRIKCVNEDDIGELTPAKPDEEKDELVETAKNIADKLGAPLNIIDE